MKNNNRIENNALVLIVILYLRRLPSKERKIGNLKLYHVLSNATSDRLHPDVLCWSKFNDDKCVRGYYLGCRMNHSFEYIYIVKK